MAGCANEDEDAAGGGSWAENREGALLVGCANEDEDEDEDETGGSR